MTRFHISPFVWMAVLAVAAGLPAAAAAPAAAATTYTITDLGSLGGGAAHGLAINASGQVTGDSVSSQLVQVPCPPKYGVPQKCFTHPDHAFVWSNGTMTDLGTLGGLDSQGVAINGSGQVVGQSGTKTGGSAFLSNGRNMKSLSAPAFVYGINESGQIVGHCYDGMFLRSYACMVSNGAITALPESNPAIECLQITTIPGNIPAAVAINTSGQVLGNCLYSAGGLAVVWTNDTPTVLPTLGGVASSGTAISSNGQVVGTSQTSTGAEDGFLWSNGTMTDLGPNFSPAAVNDSGVIVGGQFVYNGTLQNLNNLIPAGSGYQIQNATGINNNGQIVANATASGNPYQEHALLLTPH
jgi:probable HAF family extracellular repeat protein